MMPQQLMREMRRAAQLINKQQRQTNHQNQTSNGMRRPSESSPTDGRLRVRSFGARRSWPNAIRLGSRRPLTSLCALACVMLLLAAAPTARGQSDDFGSLASRFAAESAAADFRTTSTPAASGGSFNRSTGSASSPFVWQPLPLRATFRPLNRATSTSSNEQPPPAPPAAPRAPRPPRPPQPPQPPQPLALTISERSISGESPFNDNSGFSSPGRSSSNSFSSGGSGSNSAARDNDGLFSSSSSFFQPPTSFESSSSFSDSLAPTTTTTSTTTTTTTTTTPAPAPPSSTTTPRPIVDLDEDELPTRQPLTRFRPTRAPTEDEDSASSASPSSRTENIATGSGGCAEVNPNNSSRMSQECFECICEASTNCNAQSRCQTSDVRHTRCGLFLISYDQWLTTGLSRELVSREALARDAAADERAFYECVTQRDCAQRLLAIYMSRHRKDCDRDGRVDCYDLAAIHHSGMDQCASETLLDSQYWSDFNACLGFGRRR